MKILLSHVIRRIASLFLSSKLSTSWLTRMNDDDEKVSFSLNGIPLWLSKQIFDEKPSENYDSIFKKKH